MNKDFMNYWRKAIQLARHGCTRPEEKLPVIRHEKWCPAARDPARHRCICRAERVID